MLMAPPAAAHEAVGTDGTGLTLDGRPWWPAGLNAYQLATDWSINKGCGAMVDLDEFFASLPPASLTRFNALASLATDKATGELDFSAVDAVFAAAARHGQLLVPVLTTFDGACEDEVYKDRDWYAEGWREPSDDNGSSGSSGSSGSGSSGSAGNGSADNGSSGNGSAENSGSSGSESGDSGRGEPDRTVYPAENQSGMRYETWLRTAVARWHSEPALAMWELVGEPETTLYQGGPCAPDGAAVLRQFVDDAGAIVRDIDPGHLITVGLLGGGQCGTAGPEYQYVAASSNLDVLQYHDYGADGVPLPGDEFNGLAVRLDQARAVGKPLLVGEIGQLVGGDCATTRQRARDVATKIDGQRSAGTAGALLWAFVPDPRPDQCTYDIGPDDPVRDVLAERNTLE
ncbi:glycoside hydrolase family 5 protein [Rhodococcus sp. HNM0569]|uniref:glycoside hydrolase family 5 protein n=1 Tax=Rhodococcus sp. HNM0569 TaxID=2716340 RepID=UPI001F109F38|nr:glycoside hydrolase family 5 protein [Rhodococcus sp. HNM0569]